MWKPNISTGIGLSAKDVWSRAARRHAAKGQEVDVDEDAEMAFGFKIYVETNTNSTGVKVIIRWLKGHNSVVFESFCGMINRKLEEALK
jgi:23S rRNA (adenine1618-N6)-methyltransferase